MAELLIKAVDATHSDPDKDARGCYKRGDVIVAFEDGHEWGRLETLPPEKGGKCVIVRLPGVSLAELNDEIAKRSASGMLDQRIDAVARVAAQNKLAELSEITSESPSDKQKLADIRMELKELSSKMVISRRAVKVDLDQLAPIDKEAAEKDGTLTLGKEAVSLLVVEKSAPDAKQ